VVLYRYRPGSLGAPSTGYVAAATRSAGRCAGSSQRSPSYASATDSSIDRGDDLDVLAAWRDQLPEVLVGYPTVELVRDAAVLEPMGQLDLRGKAMPAEGYRLVEVR